MLSGPVFACSARVVREVISLLSGVAAGLPFVLLSFTVLADCAPNRSGEVFCGAGDCISDRSGVIWCSRYRDGGAYLTRDGHAMCGKGQCARDPRDRIFCSTEPGGAAMKDVRGLVRCYGQCELAKPEWCENSVAGRSE